MHLEHLMTGEGSLNVASRQPLRLLTMQPDVLQAHQSPRLVSYYLHLQTYTSHC